MKNEEALINRIKHLVEKYRDIPGYKALDFGEDICNAWDIYKATSEIVVEVRGE